MKNIVVFGASGNGKVVLDCIQKQGEYSVIGFIDSNKRKGSVVVGYTVLGSVADLPTLVEKYDIVGGVVAIGDNWIRKKVVDKITSILPNFIFVNVIHPNACIGRESHIGKGSVIMSGAIVGSSTRVGDFCIVNTNASIDHDSVMGDFSSLAPRVCTGGNFYLGEFSVVCLGTNIIENIRIGNHSVIGAGSLVIDNVESNILAFGSPAKVIRKRNPGESYLTGAKKRTIRSNFLKEV